MLRKICHRAGIASEDCEDVAASILADFMAKDGLNWYDPHRKFDVGENPNIPGDRYRTARFSNMLRSYASRRVLNYRDKQKVRHRREPWRLEARLTTAHDGDRTWAESEYYAEDTLDAVEDSVVVRLAFQGAREILVQRSTPTRDYDRFITLTLQHGYLDDRVDRKALAVELGISVSTVNQMIKELWKVMRPRLSGTGLIAEPKPEAT